MKANGIFCGSICVLIALAMYSGIRREVVLNRRIGEAVQVEQAAAKDRHHAILAAIGELRGQKVAVNKPAGTP